MTINARIRNEKLQYDFNSEAAKSLYQYYHQVKLMDMNILLGKKYYLLMKAE